MDTKKCCKCKNEYPKNEEYFFKKVIKQKLASGEIAEYKSFRHICKKCHVLTTEEKRVKRRCREMECDVSEYRNSWKAQYSKTRTKLPEIKHLPTGVQGWIRKKIKQGYVYITYEQYKKDCSSNISKAKRKYDYGNVDLVPKNVSQRKGIDNLTDAYIALTLNKRIKDIPKEIIETKRLLLKIKRELNLTRYGK